MDRRVLLIGFGNMGQALARGWLERGFAPESLSVVDPSATALAVARALGIDGAAEIDAAALRERRPSVIVFAVKPAQLDAALRAAAPAPGAEPLFVSIVAGKPIASISAVLGAAAIVRAMPNTPAAIGRGMTVMTASERVAAEQRTLADELLRAVGETAWLDDEGLMDAVTAVSGSGPAYVFLLIESLTRAGIALGLAPPLAEKLATVTVAGAGAYAQASQEDAAELRRRVTSPAGTTEAALRVLTSEEGLSTLLERAVRAAAARSRELSSA